MPTRRSPSTATAGLWRCASPAAMGTSVKLTPVMLLLRLATFWFDGVTALELLTVTVGTDNAQVSPLTIAGNE